MFSSGQIFKINGDDISNLEKVLNLAFELSENTPKSISYDPIKGLIFGWLGEDKYGYKSFPVKLNVGICLELAKNYLESPEVSETYNKLMNVNDEEGGFNDDDGTIKYGWEVFIPQNKYRDKEYGIEEPFYAIVGIRPILTFYGK